MEPETRSGICGRRSPGAGAVGPGPSRVLCPPSVIHSWQMLLHQNVSSKIAVHGTSFLKDMTAFIDASSIPSDFGGQGEALVRTPVTQEDWDEFKQRCAWDRAVSRLHGRDGGLSIGPRKSGGFTVCHRRGDVCNAGGGGGAVGGYGLRASVVGGLVFPITATPRIPSVTSQIPAQCSLWTFQGMETVFQLPMVVIPDTHTRAHKHTHTHTHTRNKSKWQPQPTNQLRLYAPPQPPTAGVAGLVSVGVWSPCRSWCWPCLGPVVRSSCWAKLCLLWRGTLAVLGWRAAWLTCFRADWWCGVICAAGGGGV